MPRLGKVQEVFKHNHHFVEGYDASEMVCSDPTCKARLLSNEEYNRRVEEWESYYAMCRTTPHYFVFKEMSEAFKRHDKARIAIAYEKAKNLKEDYLPKPNFFDPRGGNYIRTENI